jgi:hypothetical protein
MRGKREKKHQEPPFKDIIIVKTFSYGRIVQTEGIELNVDFKTAGSVSVDMDIAHGAYPALKLLMSDNYNGNPLPRNSQRLVVLRCQLGLRLVQTGFIEDVGSLGGVVKGHIGGLSTIGVDNKFLFNKISR